MRLGAAPVRRHSVVGVLALTRVHQWGIVSLGAVQLARGLRRRRMVLLLLLLLHHRRWRRAGGGGRWRCLVCGLVESLLLAPDEEERQEANQSDGDDHANDDTGDGAP